MVMRAVSQRSIGALKRVLDALFDRRSDVRETLYESGFPDWFIQQVASRYAWNWLEVLWGLRRGRFFYAADSPFGDEIDTIVPNGALSQMDASELGEVLIRKLAAFAVASSRRIPSQYSALGDALSRSLQLDGFGVDKVKLKLVSLEGPVSAQEEEDHLTKLVKGSGIPTSNVVLKHIQDASSLYTEGKNHPSLGQSRNIIQALIDGVSTETNTHGKHSTKLPGKTGPRIEYLKNVGFFTPDEQASFNSAWGMLSAGTHPGVPEREQARIGLVLALEFGQLLLLKFTNWKANAYSRFS